MNKQIFKLIKKYNNIVIARHINADPDAMGSTFALKESIKETFKDKNVFLTGSYSSRFLYMGKPDKGADMSLPGDYLLICLDTPDRKRLDFYDFDKINYSIKIDHHPKIEEFCDLELIDDKKSSAAELVYDLINEVGLKFNKKVAEYLFYGIVADTGRFIFDNTTPDVLRKVANLIEKYNLETSNLYFNLYKKPIGEFKLQGYMANNMQVTKNGVGYIKITNDIIDMFHMESASTGDAINEFNNVTDFVIWLSATEDKKNNIIRVSIRSRGPAINHVVEKYNGGGHAKASGARLKSFEEVDNLIKDLDNEAKKYKEGEAL